MTPWPDSAFYMDFCPLPAESVPPPFLLVTDEVSKPSSDPCPVLFPYHYTQIPPLKVFPYVL